MSLVLLEPMAPWQKSIFGIILRNNFIKYPFPSLVLLENKIKQLASKIGSEKLYELLHLAEKIANLPGDNDEEELPGAAQASVLKDSIETRDIMTKAKCS